METQKQDTMRKKDFPHRRRPWIAVFLSLLMPGMGQIYCGSITEGLVLMLVVVAFSSAWMLIMTVDKVRESTPMAVSFVACGFVLTATVIAAVDAYRRARRTRYDYILKDYNKFEVYLILLFICGAGTIGFTAMIKMNLFEAFRVTANSMTPTIMLEDRVIASKISYKNNSPARGDIVLFKNPANRKSNYIKRIVAIGGDTVEIKDGRLLINGNALKTEEVGTKKIQAGKQVVSGHIFEEHNGNAQYQIFISDDKKHEMDFGPVTVPQYHCFVMGDNRNHSEDSRHYGCLSLGALKGRLTHIYWPLGRSVSLNPQD